MMMLMHEGTPYGHLTLDDLPIDPDMLARLIGENASTVRKHLKELEAKRVFSRTEDGVIFSRRMVRDEEARERRAAGGAEGAKHGHKGAQHGVKGGRPRKEETPLDENSEGGLKPPSDESEKPPPSSSSSSSPSGNTVEPSGSTGADAPNDPPSSAIDTVKVIFDTGVRLLTEAGQAEAHARSTIGRWRKQFGDAVVLAVLPRCEIERPQQPLEWLTKALQAEARKAAGNGHGNATGRSNNGALAELERRAATRHSGQGTGEAGRRPTGDDGQVGQFALEPPRSGQSR